MNESTRRAALGAGIPVAVMAAGLGPYLAYRSDLPERVASHFAISGRPDGSMTPQQFLIAVGTLVVLGSGACAAIALTRRRFQPIVAPTVSFVGAFVAAPRGFSPSPLSASEDWTDGRTRPCPPGP